MKRNIIRFVAVAFFAWVTIALIGMIVEVGVHEANKSGMSQCELIKSHDLTDAWYECPTSMGR